MGAIETKTETWPAAKLVRQGGLRVVAIGGGTGLSTLLKGLKQFVPAPNEPILSRSEPPVIRSLRRGHCQR